jgi:beta-glucosidase/6-phospho-beta-glucosidase/beta-galactosidase
VIHGMHAVCCWAREASPGLPSCLQDSYGGFLSRELVHDFAAYADLAFRELGPLGVKRWITFNEPLSICEMGYG